jgi:hypothetical protein
MEMKVSFAEPCLVAYLCLLVDKMRCWMSEWILACFASVILYFESDVVGFESREEF